MVKGVREPWMCFDEKVFSQQWGLGKFVLIHDGPRNPIQFELPRDQVKFYTRTYQWYIDGKPVHTFLMFKYDLRAGTVEMTWHIKDPESNRTIKEEKELIIGSNKEVFNGETKSVSTEQSRE